MSEMTNRGDVVVAFAPRRNEGIKSPGRADRYVGTRIRERRIVLGMSQEKLAETLGITFQQVQKYEKGTNRVGAGRLLSIAMALGVPVSYFYEGYAATSPAAEDAAAASSDLQTLLTTREGIALAQAFVRVKNPTTRQALLAMAQAAATQNF